MKISEFALIVSLQFLILVHVTSGWVELMFSVVTALGLTISLFAFVKERKEDE